MEEIWKDVVGYEGYYEVSNLGNVRSVDREIVKSDGVVQPRTGHEMTKILNEDGYPTVKLSKESCSRRLFVHRLVAEVFVPNPNGLYEINHIDYDRQNASADNLEWATHTDNILYSKSAFRNKCNCKEVNGVYKIVPIIIKMKKHDGTELCFDSVKECAVYMIENNICKSQNADRVACKINRAIRQNITYYNCHYSRDYK